MKVEVTRSCGHVQTIEVFGKASERERKITWYETTPCRDCEMKETCEAVEMHYSQYKNEYADCKTGEYNKETKTIIVYVPKTRKAMTKTEAAEELVNQGLNEEEAKAAVEGFAKNKEQLINRFEKLPKPKNEKEQEMYRKTETAVNFLRDVILK